MTCHTSATRALGAGALLLTILTGCASITAPLDFRFKDGQDTGLVLVAFNQPTPGITWSYRRVPVGEQQDGNVLLTSGARGNEPIKNGGTVLVPFEVGGGSYEFYAWTEPSVPGALYKKSTTPFSIPFRAVPGKVVYIGDIELIVNTASFRAVVSDRSYRDVPAFLKNYRLVKEDTVVVDVHPTPTAPPRVPVPAIPPDGLKLKSTL